MVFDSKTDTERGYLLPEPLKSLRMKCKTTAVCAAALFGLVDVHKETLSINDVFKGYFGDCKE